MISYIFSICYFFSFVPTFSELPIKTLAAQRQLQLILEEKIHLYEIFPNRPDLKLPGSTVQHKFRTLEGKELPVSLLTTQYAGIEQAKHDAVSHTSSVAGPTLLGELFNCSFQWLLNGERYIGLDNPQSNEKAVYPGLCEALNLHLEPSMASINSRGNRKSTFILYRTFISCQWSTFENRA